MQWQHNFWKWLLCPFLLHFLSLPSLLHLLSSCHFCLFVPCITLPSLPVPSLPLPSFLSSLLYFSPPSGSSVFRSQLAAGKRRGSYPAGSDTTRSLLGTDSLRWICHPCCRCHFIAISEPTCFWCKWQRLSSLICSPSHCPVSNTARD